MTLLEDIQQKLTDIAEAVRVVKDHPLAASICCAQLDKTMNQLVVMKSTPLRDQVLEICANLKAELRPVMS